MDHFRRLGCKAYRVEVRHTTSPAEFIRLAFDEGPVAVPANDEVIFYVQPIEIADEVWATITASMNNERSLRIVDPFRVPDGNLSLVPFFREEC